MTEKELENLILQWLATQNIYAWKNQSMGVFDPVRKVYRKAKNVYHIKGVSDILGIIVDGVGAGRFLAIEVKKPVKFPRSQPALEKIATPEQVSFISQIKSRNGIAFFADSLETVQYEITRQLMDEPT